MQIDQEFKDLSSASETARRSKRHRMRVLVKVLTCTGEMVEGLSNDFSEHGMALYASKRFNIGQQLRVEFKLPGSQQKVSVEAVVRDCLGSRCGIEFRELAATDELLLRNCSSRLHALLAGPRETMNRVNGLTSL